MTIRRTSLLMAAMGALAVVALVVYAATGGNDSSRSGNAADVAFATDMIPHHEGAVAMARIALDRAEHNEIRTMAADVIEAQNGEIVVLGRISDELGHMGVGGAHTGMSDHANGMDGDMPALRRAKPFDRAFIDMMIPHHQGAIRMAQAQLAKGEHAGLSAISRAVIEAQSREIRAMREWRDRWYATKAPSDTAATHQAMRSLTVVTGAEPGPSAATGPLRAQLLAGALPRRQTVATVLSDEDCAADDVGVSHCRNRMRLPNGKTLTVRHPHRMMEVACLSPGEKVHVSLA